MSDLATWRWSEIAQWPWSEIAQWFGTVSALAISLYSIRVAKRLSTEANDINKELLDLQLKDQARRLRDDDAEAEAKEIVSAARVQWREQLLQCKVADVFWMVPGDGGATSRNSIAQIMEQGMDVPWTKPNSDMAIRIEGLAGVEWAVATKEGYCVVLQFNRETFQLEK